MSEEVKQLSKDEAIALVGGKREEIHCFIQGGMMLVGADWGWDEFERAVDRAESRVEAGEQAQRMKHPLAMFVDGKWKFFAAATLKEGE